ncbi:MAG: sensor histidine kinase [Epsilonproteobacteria bacterium]|nr:sensor histidine kinase [Campylobacterota bacterium]
MIYKLTHFFQTHPRKESMLLTMIYTFIFVDCVFVFTSFYLSQHLNMMQNIITLLFVLLILKRYQNTKDIRHTAILFLIIMEINSGIALAGNETQNFAAIFPFIYIAGFFFFLALKEAILATILHIIYWSLMVKIAFEIFPKGYSIMPANVINDITVVIILFFLGIFYQFTTEMAYTKLETAHESNKKLLKEIHHKIKNNLNFVSAVLGLQKRHIIKYPSEDTIDVLQDAKHRIQSIALMHQAIDQTKHTSQISFEPYLGRLITLINNTHRKKISLTCHSNNISLSEKSMHRLGLIINELLNSSLKMPQHHLSIEISLQKKADKYHFSYSDKNLVMQTANLHFQEKLIALIIEQMEATLEISPTQGTICQVWFQDDR